MIWLIALLACNPEAKLDEQLGDDVEPIATAAAATSGSMIHTATPTSRRAPPPYPGVKPPEGAAIVRDCYGGGYGESRSRGASRGGYGGGKTASSKPQPRPSAAPAPSAPPPPVADAAPAAADAAAAPSGGELSGLIGGSTGAAEGGLGSRGSGAGGGGSAASGPGLGGLFGRSAPAEEAAAAEPEPSPMPAKQEAKREDQAKTSTKEKRAEKPMEPADNGDGIAMDMEEAELDDRDGDLAQAQQRMQRKWDWGATVYLSNDDSMSLASAQRLLFAVQSGRHFSAGEVRPHELLNYFSFDTAPVPEGELFSVQGAAEQNGDTISVALAVQGGTPEREPLDLTVVVDRSGSMRAEGRMEYTKRGLNTMAGSLKKGDRIDLVLFDGMVCTPLEDFVVGRDDPQLLTQAINQMQPRGSTDLDAGLREAYRIQNGRSEQTRHGRNQRVMLLTDAFLNTGNVNQDLVSEVGKQFEDNDIRLTGIGVGRDFNDTMLNKLTEKGKGAYVYLGSEAVVDRVFGPMFESMVSTIAHDVHFALKLPESMAMERFYGEESSTVKADVQPIHYYAGTSQVFLQDLYVDAAKLNRKDPVELTVTWTDAASGEPGEKTFSTTVGALLDGDPRNLNKAQALMKWTDLLAAKAMGDHRCSGLDAYRSEAATVPDDAELAYVSSLTGKLCGVDMSAPPPKGVAYKVKVDSDMPIAEVSLACGPHNLKQSLSGSDTVARFEAFPGACTLTLQGNVPMTTKVEVPQTGGDVRCMIRAGRMQCS